MRETNDRRDRYEAVDPGNGGSVARLARIAERSGFDGIVLRWRPPGIAPDDLDRNGDQPGVRVVSGATVDATDRSRAGSELAGLRGEVTVLLGRAETAELRHFLAGQERLDVLHIPANDAGAVGHSTVTRAAEHGVFLEVDLGPVLRNTGRRRVAAISGIRRLARFVADADCPYVVSATPRSQFHIRAPRELVALGETIGLDPGFVENGIGAWSTIVARTRRNRDDRFIEPGVEVAPDETDGG